jgi:hypothetical protein
MGLPYGTQHERRKEERPMWEEREKARRPFIRLGKMLKGLEAKK